jgi:c-di-GMP-binding flagellar brake protein YcgR
VRQPTLIDMLVATARAMAVGLRKTCSLDARFDALRPADASFPPAGMVAAELTQEPGPIAALAVGADPDLARRVAAELLRHRSRERETLADPVATGLRVLSRVLGEHLERANPWYAGTGRSEPHDPGRAQVDGRDAMGYVLSLVTECGALRTRLLLPVTEERVTRDPTEDEELAADAAVEPLLEDLVRSSPGAQIELPLDRFTTMLHPVRLLGRAAHRKEPVLLVAAPQVAADDGAGIVGRTVRVYVISSGRLLGFEAPVRAIVRYPLLDELTLPALALEIPRRIGPGQRRRAFRVVPGARVLGEVEPWRADAGGRTGTPVPVAVRDLSFTGVGLLSRNPRAAAFQPGEIVIVRADLLDPYGHVELAGIVRHVGPIRGDHAVSNVGVELLQEGAWRSFEGANDRVRAYVMELQRSRLGEEAA